MSLFRRYTSTEGHRIPVGYENTAIFVEYRDTVSIEHYLLIHVKNFHGSLTTVVRAQNDTSKTANITDTIFDRTLV